MSSPTSPRPLFWQGPLLVSFGAFLWATDALFRSQLTHTFSTLFIVTFSHLLCFAVTLPLLLRHRQALKSLSARDWAGLGFLAGGGSILAMICFTQAFAQTTNYNIPILLQKLQPVVAIALARLVLKEKPSRVFFVCAGLAIFGAYLISFGDLSAWTAVKDARVSTIAYTLAAAAIWGACTVASRFVLSNNHSYVVVTVIRYELATVGLLILSLATGVWDQTAQLTPEHLKNFALMAFLPGLAALFIYYQGLEKTSASTATICELAFPFGAIFINWIFLDSPLNSLQIAGAVLLTVAVTVINFNHRVVTEYAS